MSDLIDTATGHAQLAALEESLCTCGAGHSSREGHTPWCSAADGLDLFHRLLDALDAKDAEIERLRQRRDSTEEILAGEILSELARARAKFPGKNVTFAALVEEVGELATATFEECADRVRKEAVQVAVMAMRMVLDGDHSFELWREERGLDPLDPALRALAALNGEAAP